MASEVSLGLELDWKSSCSWMMVKSSNPSITGGDFASESCADLLMDSRNSSVVDLYWFSHANMSAMMLVQPRSEWSDKQETSCPTVSFG